MSMRDVSRYKLFGVSCSVLTVKTSSAIFHDKKQFNVVSSQT